MDVQFAVFLPLAPSSVQSWIYTYIWFGQLFYAVALNAYGFFSLPLLGFDLMEYFNVRDFLGEKFEPGQTPYVRLGTMPIVQKTE